MIDTEAKVKQLLDTSREVFGQSVMQNGAILASNNGNLNAEVNVQDYAFVWPRDASFVARACMILGMNDVPENFFKWCENFALDESNLLWHRYKENGEHAGFFVPEWFEINTGLVDINKAGNLSQYIHPRSIGENGMMKEQLQPDQNGLVLWALYEYCLLFPEKINTLKSLIERLADGLCSIWDVKGQTYKYLYFDLWEEKIGYPGVNITYSVATACAGIEYAIFIVGEKESWRNTVNSMRASLENASTSSMWQAVYGKKFNAEDYTRLFSGQVLNKKKANVTVDAGLLALIYPTDIVFSVSDKINLMNYLILNLSKGDGLIRYPGDTFGGEDLLHSNPNTTENTWPLLGLWASVAIARSGHLDLARSHFARTLKSIDKYFPEQMDENGKEKGVKPLVWAHAMFVIASKELGYIV